MQWWQSNDNGHIENCKKRIDSATDDGVSVYHHIPIEETSHHESSSSVEWRFFGWMQFVPKNLDGSIRNGTSFVTESLLDRSCDSTVRLPVTRARARDCIWKGERIRSARIHEKFQTDDRLPQWYSIFGGWRCEAHTLRSFLRFFNTIYTYRWFLGSLEFTCRSQTCRSIHDMVSNQSSERFIIPLLFLKLSLELVPLPFLVDNPSTTPCPSINPCVSL